MTNPVDHEGLATALRSVEKVAEAQSDIRVSVVLFDAVNRARALLERVKVLEGALGPFAGLDTPFRSAGNARAYAIRHADIEHARTALKGGNHE